MLGRTGASQLFNLLFIGLLKQSKKRPKDALPYNIESWFLCTELEACKYREVIIFSLGFRETYLFQSVMCKFCGVHKNREARGTLPHHIPSIPQEREDNSKMNSNQVLVAFDNRRGSHNQKIFSRETVNLTGEVAMEAGWKGQLTTGWSYMGNSQIQNSFTSPPVRLLKLLVNSLLSNKRRMHPLFARHLYNS